MKKLIILFLTIIFITGCSYDPYDYPKELEINTKEAQINVFSTLDTKDYITTNGKVLNNTKIEVNKIGNYTLTYEIKYKKKTYKYDYSYSVIDVTPPVFISASSKKTVQVNNDIYPCDSITFADDYDNKPSCKIIGEYDLTKIGTYNVKYQISDSSNNTNEKDLVINVVEKINTSTSTTSSSSPKLYFDTVIEKYKTDKTMIGIDVSKWQGDIDFNKVKEAGCEFVMMRIGVSNNVGDEVSIDRYYKENIKKAKEARLLVGVYIYTSATNEETAIKHANWVIDTLNGEKLDLGISYDWENWSKFMSYEISLHTFYNNFYKFAEVITKNGYDVSLYSSKYYLENIWENKYNYPVWLAHYTSNTNYKGNYKMWQLSNVGRINGIYGDVDIDILYK